MIELNNMLRPSETNRRFHDGASRVLSSADTPGHRIQVYISSAYLPEDRERF
ncbi:hypothetical protein NOR53_916 [gamma proteobacterium NOR5-3]|nr:hypothetical protein NOR53_916 [gamma proteobacterium NOR5-3]